MGAPDLPVSDLPSSELAIGRWGNSLAVRIPAKLARELGVGEGDTLKAKVIGPAQLTLQAGPKPQLSMAEFVSRLQALHSRIPITQPVVEEMRRNARY